MSGLEENKELNVVPKNKGALVRLDSVDRIVDGFFIIIPFSLLPKIKSAFDGSYQVMHLKLINNVIIGNH